MKVKTVTAPVPSPDGRLAVWTETGPVMDGEKSEPLTHVFLAHSDGSGRLELTRGEKSADAPAFAADSASVFFASERSGKRNLYRIAVDGGEAERITDWSGTLGTYAVSPNGKWIAFISDRTGREEIYISDELGKTVKKLTDADCDKNAIVWAADSKSFLWTGTDHKLHRMDVDSGNDEVVVSSDAGNIGDPQFSPDGKWLSYSKLDDLSRSHV